MTDPTHDHDASSAADHETGPTEHDATALVEAHLRDAIAALPDQPALRPLRNGRRHCADPVTGEDSDTVAITRGFWLDGIPANRVGPSLAALRAHWGEHEFEIIADTSPVERFVEVQNAEGYRMSIVVSDAGVLSIGASTPCVLPS